MPPSPNPKIALHEPYFDRIPLEDSGIVVTANGTATTAGAAGAAAAGKDMFIQPSEPYPDTFPPSYPAFRRMSADTQTSSDSILDKSNIDNNTSLTSSGINSNPGTNNPSPTLHNANINANNSLTSKMAAVTAPSSIVLPPIHDLSRPLSPETSDGSSINRSPQWLSQPPQAPLHPHHGSPYAAHQLPQHHQQQHHHHHHQQQQQHHHHHGPQQSYHLPALDHHSQSHNRRPQLHINPPAELHRVSTPSYPTPTTASTLNGYNSSSSNSAGNNNYHPHAHHAPPPPHHPNAYAPYPQRRPEDHYRMVPPPPPAPLVTPATLAAAVGTQQRRRGKLPKPVTEFLKKWLLAHTDHPYPTEDEKKWLCSETGLSMSQVSNWMINVRILRFSSIFISLLPPLHPFGFFVGYYCGDLQIPNASFFRLVVVFSPQLQRQTPPPPLQQQQQLLHLQFRIQLSPPPPLQPPHLRTIADRLRFVARAPT
ncbi:hypothetical protein FRC14_004859 [Serendipita sp. 396]|nr:hypothetical protein FRC14_004859 [Serendipita sp. 396]